ncbi:hypothetical protein [Sphingomonas sp.]|uniref:hypothetical protein n=1 Tax=Sphingomonas sp. TaxID=28214 RepID=UPI0025D46EDA|nr:hypothetical protein [Sphingomonas sp.]
MMTSKISFLTLAAASLAVALPALVAPTPALAQNRVREIEVFGNDPCPRSTDDDIIVCARKSEKDRYRIPEKLRQSGSYQSRQSWANRAIAFESYGKTGINSCSAVGPGGFTGCTEQLTKQAFKELEEERRNGTAPDQ